MFFSPVLRHPQPQELETAKARLEEWKTADGQLDEAMSVRKEAFLGSRTMSEDVLSRSSRLQIG